MTMDSSRVDYKKMVTLKISGKLQYFENKRMLVPLPYFVRQEALTIFGYEIPNTNEFQIYAPWDYTHKLTLKTPTPSCYPSSLHSPPLSSLISFINSKIN